MAADGQSIFVASGDNNAWTAGQLAYPAEDPDVTAVGGTILTTSSADGPFSYAVAWGGGNSSCTNHEDGSGGGISPDDLPIPPYQQLSGVINSSNEGSTAYRNGPDVAAQADCVNYYCANGVCGDGLGGTSLAAPTWAGIAALANEAGSEYGTAPDGIGLVNETIYPLGLGSDYGNNFHDVVSGNNDTYSAVSGYDLVTGWGSPNVWNLVYSLSGAPQATKPVVDYVVTDGPSTCGNALAGYDNPCYLILSGTATVGSNEAMYIDGQQGSSPYSYSYTEDWGTGYCETINGYGYQCFGYAPFPTKTFYATESGYGNSVQVQSGQ